MISRKFVGIDGLKSSWENCLQRFAEATWIEVELMWTIKIVQQTISDWWTLKLLFLLKFSKKQKKIIYFFLLFNIRVFNLSANPDCSNFFQESFTVPVGQSSEKILFCMTENLSNSFCIFQKSFRNKSSVVFHQLDYLKFHFFIIFTKQLMWLKFFCSLYLILLFLMN